MITKEEGEHIWIIDIGLTTAEDESPVLEYKPVEGEAAWELLGKQDVRLTYQEKSGSGYILKLTGLSNKEGAAVMLFGYLIKHISNKGKVNDQKKLFDRIEQNFGSQKFDEDLLKDFIYEEYLPKMNKANKHDSASTANIIPIAKLFGITGDIISPIREYLGEKSSDPNLTDASKINKNEHKPSTTGRTNPVRDLRSKLPRSVSRGFPSAANIEKQKADKANPPPHTPFGAKTPTAVPNIIRDGGIVGVSNNLPLSSKVFKPLNSGLSHSQIAPSTQKKPTSPWSHNKNRPETSTNHSPIQMRATNSSELRLKSEVQPVARIVDSVSNSSQSGGESPTFAPQHQKASINRAQVNSNKIPTKSNMFGDEAENTSQGSSQLNTIAEHLEQSESGVRSSGKSKKEFKQTTGESPDPLSQPAHLMKSSGESKSKPASPSQFFTGQPRLENAQSQEISILMDKYDGDIHNTVAELTVVNVESNNASAVADTSKNNVEADLQVSFLPQGVRTHSRGSNQSEYNDFNSQATYSQNSQLIRDQGNFDSNVNSALATTQPRLSITQLATEARKYLMESDSLSFGEVKKQFGELLKVPEEYKEISTEYSYVAAKIEVDDEKDIEDISQFTVDCWIGKDANKKDAIKKDANKKDGSKNNAIDKVLAKVFVKAGLRNPRIIKVTKEYIIKQSKGRDEYSFSKFLSSLLERVAQWRQSERDDQFIIDFIRSFVIEEPMILNEETVCKFMSKKLNKEFEQESIKGEIVVSILSMRSYLGDHFRQKSFDVALNQNLEELFSRPAGDALFQFFSFFKMYSPETEEASRYYYLQFEKYAKSRWLDKRGRVVDDVLSSPSRMLSFIKDDLRPYFKTNNKFTNVIILLAGEFTKFRTALIGQDFSVGELEKWLRRGADKLIQTLAVMIELLQTEKVDCSGMVETMQNQIGYFQKFINTKMSVIELKKLLAEHFMEIDHPNIDELNNINPDTLISDTNTKLDALKLMNLSDLEGLRKSSVFVHLFKQKLEIERKEAKNQNVQLKITVEHLNDLISLCKNQIQKGLQYQDNDDREIISVIMKEVCGSKDKFTVNMVPIFGNLKAEIDKKWTVYVVRAFSIYMNNLKSTIDSISNKLKQDGKINSEGDSELDQMIDKFASTDQKTNLMAEYVNPNKESKLTEYLENIEHYKNFEDFIDIVQKFNEKNGCNLDDMLVGAELVYHQVKLSDISTVRRATKMYDQISQKTTYYYFHYELDKICKANALNTRDFVKSIAMIKEPLMKCSSDFARSDLSGQNLVQIALNKSSTIFEYNNESRMYNVFCIASSKKEISPGLDSQQSNERKITQGELEQVATKLTIAGENDSEWGQDIDKNRKLFLKFMEYVRKVQNNLNLVKLTGEVFDLKLALTSLTKSKHQKQLLENGIKINEFETIEIKLLPADMMMKSNISENDSNSTLDIIQALDESINELSQKCITIKLNPSDEESRIRGLLSSEQRLFISKYYLRKNQLVDGDEVDGGHVLSIFRYLTNESDVAKLKELLTLDLLRTKTEEEDQESKLYLNTTLFKALAEKTSQLRSNVALNNRILNNLAPLTFESDGQIPLEDYVKLLVSYEVNHCPPANSFIFGNDMAIQEHRSNLNWLVKEKGIITVFNVPEISRQEVMPKHATIITILPESKKDIVNRAAGIKSTSNTEKTQISNYLNNMKVKVFRSELAGMGKSALITKQSKLIAKGKDNRLSKVDKRGEESHELLELFLSGDIRPSALDSRLDRIATELRNPDTRELSLHVKIEMMDNMIHALPQLDLLLFRLCFVKCMPYKQGYLFFDKVKHFMFEIANGYEDMLMSRLPVLSLGDCRPTVIAPLGINCSRADEIRQIEFEASQYESPIHASTVAKTSVSVIIDKNRLENDNADPESLQKDFSIAVKYWNCLMNRKLFPVEEESKVPGPKELAKPITYYYDGYNEKPAKMDSSNYEDISEEERMRMLHEIFTNKGDRDFQQEKGTLAQLVCMLRILGQQLREFENVPLDEETLTDMVQNMQYSRFRMAGFNKSVKEIRRSYLEEIITLIFNTARSIAWGSSIETREITKQTKAIQNQLTDKRRSVEQISQDELALYKDKIKEISTRKAKDVIYLVMVGKIIKLIYDDVSLIPKTLAGLNCDNAGKSYPDLKSISRNGSNLDFVKELAEGLNLITQNVTEDSDKRNVKSIESSSQAQNRLVTGLDGKMRYDPFVDKLEKRISEFNNGQGFVTTVDNYLKIMKITLRADLGLPIVIMGATGCGKTYLVNFLSSCLLLESFKLVAMHPGLSEKDLVQELKDAVITANKLGKAVEGGKKMKRVWVLFDEFNTSPLQSLISQVMVERKVTFADGFPDIPPNIVFVAACNPYLVQTQGSMTGLVHDRSSGTLMHRVFPIPERLMNCLWNFEQLKEEAEKMYISKMLQSVHKEGIASIETIILICQDFLRKKENENSASLRDVARYIKIWKACSTLFKTENKKDYLMAAYICYFLRIENPLDRKELYQKIASRAFTSSASYEFSVLRPINEALNMFTKQIEDLQIIPKDVVLNQPLKENLLAMFIGLYTKTPVIICGKPGTSKTLSVGIIEKLFSLTAEQKEKTTMFKNLPSLIRVNFWGAETTTTSAIERVFKRAQDLQKLDTVNTRVVIVFDEIGLAEIAKENPLKILHYLLEPSENQVGFIGLSNWRLDLSKMNRVLFVSRPDPTEEDLVKCFNMQFSKDENLAHTAMTAFVKAYSNYRRIQSGDTKGQSNFHGTRDLYSSFKQFNQFYSILKEELKSDVNGDKSGRFQKSIIEFILAVIIQRNFSGTTIEGKSSVRVMAELVYENLKAEDSGSLYDIHYNRKSLMLSSEFVTKIETRNTTKNKIFLNLLDPNARHLMLFTENSLIEDISVEMIKDFTCKTLKRDPQKFEYFKGGFSLEEDRDILRKLSPMISEGYTVVLKDLDSIYGSLYDIFNQRYETKSGLVGCHIVSGDESQWIKVHKDFRCVVIMQSDIEGKLSAEDKERRQQPPFLNRFEKHILTKADVLTPSHLKMLEILIATEFGQERHLKNNVLIHNLSKEILLSLVQKVLGSDKVVITEDLKALEELTKKLFLNYTNEDMPKNTNVEHMGKNESEEMKGQSPSKSKLEKESPAKPELEAARKKMNSLYSRNMIIEKYLAEGDEIKYDDFIKSHDWDTLAGFSDHIDSPFYEKYCAVVFTLSQHLRLPELKRWKILEGKSFVGLSKRQRNDLMADSIENGKARFCIQISSKDECSLIPHLKNDLVGLTKAHNDIKVILVVQSVPILESIENLDCEYAKAELYTSIDFEVDSWEMKVIDNINGCGYKEFYEMLKKPYIVVIEELSAKLGSPFQSLAFERLLNNISTYMTVTTSSEISLRDLSVCISSLKKSPEVLRSLLTMVVSKLKSNHKDNSHILDMIKSDNYRRAGDFADVQTYIYSLLLDRFDLYMRNLVEEIGQGVGFSFIAKTVCVNDETSKRVIETRWLRPVKDLKIKDEAAILFSQELVFSGPLSSLSPDNVPPRRTSEENPYFEPDRDGVQKGGFDEFEEEKVKDGEAGYRNIIEAFDASGILKRAAPLVRDAQQSILVHRLNLTESDGVNVEQVENIEIRPALSKFLLDIDTELLDKTLPNKLNVTNQEERIFVGCLITEKYWKDSKRINLRIASLQLLSNMARIVIEDRDPSQKKTSNFGLIQSIMLVMLLAEIFEDELCLLQNPEELPKYDLHPDKYSVEGLSTTFRSGSVLNVRHIEDIADIDINNALRSVGAAKEALSAFKVNFIRKKEHKLHLKKPIERLEICFINYVATRKLTPVSDEYHYRDDKDVTRLEELLNMFPDIPDEVLSRTIGMAVSATEDLPTAQHLLGLVLKGSMVAKKNFANALTNLLFDGQNKQTLSTAFTTAPLSLFNNAIIAQLKANNTSDKLREILNMIRSNLYNKLVLSSSMTSTGSGPSLNDILPSGVEFEGLEEVYNDVKLKFIITGKQVAGDVRTLEAMIASKHIVPKSREATITVALKALYKIHGFVRHEPSRGDSKLNEKTAVCLLLIRQVTRVNENMAQFAAMLLKGDDREFRNSVRKWYHVLTAAYLFAMKLITETSGTVQLLKQEYFDVYKRANTSRQTASLDNAESVLSSCSGAVMDSFIKKVNNGETLHPAIYGTTNRLLDLAIDNLNYDIKHPTIPTATLISFFQACLSRLETTNITKNSYNNQLRSELQSVESEFEMEKGTLSSTIKQERARWIKYFEPNLQVTESIINDETDKLSDSIEKAYGPRMQRLYNFLIDKTKVDTTNMVKALESFSSSPVCSALYELLSSENVLKLALELLIKLKKVPVDVMSQAKKREEIIRYLEKHGDLVYLLQKEGELTDLLEENTFSQNSDQISYYFYTLATAASRVVNDIIEKLDKAWSFKPVFQRQKAKLSEFDESIIDSFQKSLDDKKLKETLERNCLWLEGAPFALDENSALDDIQFKVVHELPVFEADPCDKPANMSGKPGAHGRAKQTSDIDTAILDTLKRLKKVQSDETKFTNTQMQRLVSLYNLVVLKKVAVDSSQSQLNLLDHLMQRMPQLLKDYNGKPDARISEALSEYLKDDEALEKCKIIQNANIEDLQLVRVVQLAARYELDNGSSLSPDLQKKVQAYKEEFKMENKNAVKPIVLVIEAALQKQKVSKTAQKLADEHMSIITRIHESARIKSQDSSRFGEPDPALFVKAYALATVVTAKFGIDN